MSFLYDREQDEYDERFWLIVTRYGKWHFPWVTRINQRVGRLPPRIRGRRQRRPKDDS